MADNPTVVGVPQPVAADDVGGNLYQRVKVAIGPDNSAADIAGDTVNGIKVDVSRVQTPVIMDPIAVGARTVTRVPAATGETTIAAANANRRRLWIYNDSDQRMLVKCGAGVSSISFSFPLKAGSLYEMPQPIDTGVITAFWEGATPTGGAMVTES